MDGKKPCSWTTPEDGLGQVEEEARLVELRPELRDALVRAHFVGFGKGAAGLARFGSGNGKLSDRPTGRPAGQLS